MPINYFPQLDEGELLAQLNSIARKQGIGEIQFVTTPNGQAAQSWTNTLRADLIGIRTLYSLHKLAPSRYENPYLQRVRTTLPNYTGTVC